MTGAAAVLFDVDGTLVDHDGAARRGLAEHTGSVDELVWARWVDIEHRHFERYLAGEATFEEARSVGRFPTLG